MDKQWTFLTNHGAIFLHLINHPGDTIRQISDHLNLAERTVTGILADLRRDGYISATKAGRHNVYTIHPDLPMRPPSQASQTVNEFFGLLPNRRARQKMHV
jgi:DNA-binding transcriptional ArsR family regulator